MKLREHRKKLSDVKLQDTRTGNICAIKRYGCLKKYPLRLQNSARLPQISYMLAAVAEHLSERQRVMRSNR